MTHYFLSKRFFSEQRARLPAPFFQIVLRPEKYIVTLIVVISNQTEAFLKILDLLTYILVLGNLPLRHPWVQVPRKYVS